MKLTPWFPPDVKPVHVGWYQRAYKSPNILIPDWWDGKGWRIGFDDGTFSARVLHPGPFRWRGLAEKPKGAK